jgi:hypothetical protein
MIFQIHPGFRSKTLINFPVKTANWLCRLLEGKSNNQRADDIYIISKNDIVKVSP